MKNLKFNKESLIRLISTGMVLVTLGNGLTGCSVKSENNEDSKDSKKIEKIVSNNKMIEVADLRIKDTETDTIVENVDAVLVDNKLEKEFDIISVMFDSSIKTVQIGNELVPVSRLKLVDVKTNEELNAIDYALVGNELISIKDYYKNEKTTDIVCEHICDECAALQEDVYVELTDERFFELADAVYKKYSEMGLDVSKEEVIDFVMFVNADRIAKDNKELSKTIVGKRNFVEVENNVFNVHSAIQTKNNFNYCEKGMGFDSLILVSDTLFDAKERKVVENIEKCFEEIFEARNNSVEFNNLVKELFKGKLTATNKEFNMENGAGYNVMNIIINFIRINFRNILNAENAEEIKYFISYAEEYGTEYYENSRSTAYYAGMYNLLTELTNCYTRTK